jgi:hypothetical protein
MIVGPLLGIDPMIRSLAAAKVDRRFTLLDAMVLVAATALGMAVSRAMHAALPAHFFQRNIIYRVFPYLVSTTFGLLALSLRQPRPKLRRLMTRPGAAACVTPSLALVATAATTALQYLTASGWTWSNPPFLATWASNSREGPPFAVASAWAMLALTSRWRARPSWIDRLGRLLGLGWIAMYLREVALVL